MKTKLFILAVFVMVLCCITAVGAADANMTEIALEEPTDDVGLESSVDVVDVMEADAKVDAEMNVTLPEDMNAGGRYVIDITMPEDSDNWVDVYYDDEEYYFTDVALEKGKGSFRFVPGELGNHSLNLHYYGNEIYNAKIYSYQFEINDYSLSLFEGRLEIEDTLFESLNVPKGFNGTVFVTINGTEYKAAYSEEYDVSYNFYVNGSDLVIGDNSVNIYYPGDEKFPEINVTDILNIYNRSSILINVDYPENITAGVPLSFDITLSEKINVTMGAEYYDDWDGYWEWFDDVEIIDGKGSFSYYIGHMGDYALKVYWYGNEEYRSAQKKIYFTVENYTIGFNNPIDYAPDAEFYLSVPNGFYGDVNVTINGDEYVLTNENWYTFTPNLKIGTFPINIYYKGDSDFHELNITGTLEVIPYISVSEDSFVVGSDEFIRMHMPDDANGTFVLYDNGTEIDSVKVENGNAEVSLKNWSIGKYNIFVDYKDDGKYSANRTLEFNIHPAIQVPYYVLKGDDAVISVTGDGDNLTVYEDSGELLGFAEFKDGYANVTLSNLPLGMTYVDVVYTYGNYTYTFFKEIYVIDIEWDIENGSYVPSSLSRAYLNIVPYEYYTVDVYFDGEYLDEYDIYGDPIYVSLQRCNLTEGQHSLEAFVGSLSKKITFNTFPVNVTAPSYIFEGDDSNITIEMPKEFNGNITASYEDYPDYVLLYSGNAVDGRAVIPLKNLKAGSYDILIEYDDGNNTFSDRRSVEVYSLDISIEEGDVLTSAVSGFEVRVNPQMDADVYYYFDGNFKQDCYMNWGYLNIIFDEGDLTSGKHTISLSIDNGENQISKNVTFYVLSIDVAAPKYNLVGNESYINVKAPKDLGGNVTAYIKINGYGSEYEQFAFEDIVNDEANISLASLNAGYKNIKLVYATGNVTIVKEVEITVLDIEFSIENNSVVFSKIDGLNVDLKAYCYGDLIFKFDGEEKGYTSSGERIFFALDNCNMSTGKHSIEFIYSNGDYMASKAIEFNTTEVLITIPEKIAKNYNNAGVSSAAYVYTQDDATGNITCIVDGSQFDFQELWGSYGNYYIYLSNLDVGYHDVEIIYSGDANYPRTTKSAKVYVDYVPTLDSTYLTYAKDDLRAVLPSTEGITVKIDGNESQFTVEDHYLTVPKSQLDMGSHRIIIENGTGIVLNDTFMVVGNIVYDSIMDEISLTLPEDANGTLIIKINRFDSSTYQDIELVATEEIPLVDGKAVFENDLIPDCYHYICDYSGDDYDVATAHHHYYGGTRYKLDKSVIHVNESAVVSIMVGENKGNFTISILKDYATVDELTTPIVDNRANITLSNLRYGVYSINCYYVVDENWNWGPQFTLEVLRYDNNWTVDIADINKGETAFVNIELPEDASGLVYVYVDGKMLAKLRANATLSIPLENLTVGAHPIEVKYSGNGKYMDNATLTAIIVNDVKLESSINATGCEIIDGQTATINANVTDGATGLVLVEIDGKKYFEEISQGSVAINIDNLNVGNYTATVTYNGDDKYNKSSTEVFIKVNEKADSIIEITNSDLSIGDSATITATVNGAAADIAYTINGVEGTTIDRVEAMTYTITATFAGNATNKANSTSKTFTVEKLATKISVNVKDAKVGETAVITVNVTGSRAVVLVFVGDYIYAMDSDSVLELVYYEPGVHNVSAIYMGDDVNARSISEVVTLNITDKAPANVVVECPDNVVVGDVVVINITADTTADLIAFIGNETVDIVDGTITVNADNAGLYSIDWVATENGDFYGDIGYIVFEAVKRDATVAIELPQNITIGEDVVISVSSDSDADVVVYVDGEAQKVVNGAVTVNVVAGTHTVVASVDETDMYNFAMSNSTFTVDKLASAFTVSVKDAKVGETAVISFNVTEGNVAVVLVRVGDTVYAVPSNSDLEVVLDKPGEYEVSAFYIGDDIYGSSVSETVILNITDKAPANVAVDGPDMVFVGDVVVFNITADTTADIFAFIGNETIDIINGTITFNADNAGLYCIDLVAMENEDFYGDSVGIIFAALKREATVDIELPQNITIGEDVVISVSSDSDGDVVVYVDGEAQKVVNGTVTVNAVAGTHTIVASVDETDMYNFAMSNSTFTVDKLASAFTVSVKDAKVGETAVISFNVTEGNVAVVLVRVGDTVYAVPSNSDLEVVLDKPGEYEVSAFYIGDNVYESSVSEAVVLNITDKVPANVAVDGPDMVFVGDVVVFNITANTTADIFAFIGNETIDIINGTITFNADNAGLYCIDLVAVENEDFYGDSVGIIFAALKREATVAIGLPQNITVGEDVVISVSSDSDGDVVVYVDGEAQKVVNGTVTVNAVAGTHTVVVSVDETDMYNFAMSNVTFTVDKLTSKVNIIVKDAKVGETAVIKVNVSEGDWGVVLVQVGDTVYAVPSDSDLEVVLDKPGEYEVFAVYMGSDVYTPSRSEKVTLNITDKAPANVVVECPDMVMVGDVVVINITADTTADIFAFAGNETFDIINGTITLKVNYSAVYCIDLVAEENEDFYGDSGYVLFLAVKREATVDIELPQNITAGEDVVISVSSDSDGDVVVYVDGEAQNVVNGTVTVKATPGTHTIVAGVGETRKFYDAIAFKSFTVSKQASDVNVTIADAKLGENIPVSVSIPGATGNVSVIVDGVATDIPLDENGTAEYTIPAISAGDHSIVVIYSGDDAHDAAYTATAVSVKVTATEFADIVVSGDGAIAAKLVDNSGGAIANAVIDYAINGKAFKTTTDASGAFAINASSNSVVEIKYAGNGTFLPVNTSITIKDLAPIREATVILGADYTQYAIEYGIGERGQNFTVKLVDANGKPLINKTVLIGYNGKTLERTTDKDGFAYVQINLRDENRLTFAATFLGDEDYNATMSVYLITIVKKPVTITASAKSYKASATTKKYTVTLKTIQCASADGKTYFGAGKEVTMKINGRTYTATTDDSGKATFSLKITKKGKFQASINYVGDKTYEAASKSVKITIN